MNFFLIISFTLICGSYSDPIPAAANELTNPPGKGLDIGEWGTMVKCPAGEVAVTFQLLTQPYQGKGDDTGLNGIKFQCAKFGSTEKGPIIASANGSHGEWGTEHPCEGGAVVGYQLQIDAYDESFDDCWGVVNARLFCSSGVNITGHGSLTKEGPGSAPNATWTPEQKCPAKQAICGIQTRVLDKGADKCGITNVKMECCDEGAAGAGAVAAEGGEAPKPADGADAAKPADGADAAKPAGGTDAAKSADGADAAKPADGAAAPADSSAAPAADSAAAPAADGAAAPAADGAAAPAADGAAAPAADGAAAPAADGAAAPADGTTKPPDGADAEAPKPADGADAAVPAAALPELGL